MGANNSQEKKNWKTKFLTIKCGRKLCAINKRNYVPFVLEMRAMCKLIKMINYDSDFPLDGRIINSFLFRIFQQISWNLMV